MQYGGRVVRLSLVEMETSDESSAERPASIVLLYSMSRPRLKEVGKGWSWRERVVCRGGGLPRATPDGNGNETASNATDSQDSILARQSMPRDRVDTVL